jgi:hypothetical protein
MEWGVGITGKEAFFFCSYLGNTWNFMCCSNNSTERIYHKHFVWHQDSVGVPFAHEKNNQSGDQRKMKPRNLYPNPFDPMIDTILATFEYLVVFPEVLGDPDGPLYPGSEQSQSKIFSTIVALLLKAHKQEVNKMGYNILEIGVHSIRKGVTTEISSGTTAAPSSMSVNLQGGRSMGSVQDVYMLYKKVGGQYISRLMAGLQMLSEKFAVSNPDFLPVRRNEEGLFVTVPKTPENESELNEKIRVVIEGIFGHEVPNVICPFLRIGMACHLHHRLMLDEFYPNDSALWLTALYTSSEVKDLQNHVKVGFPWDEKYSMYWEQPTGIPPYVIELAKLAELKTMVGEILPGVERVI